jgi:hypothetical protein
MTQQHDPNEPAGVATRQEIMDEEPPIVPPSGRRGFQMPRGGGGGNSSTLMTVIISAVVALVLILGTNYLGVTGTVSQKDFTTNLAAVSKTIETMDGRVTVAKNTADLAKQTADAIKIPDVSRYVTADALNTALKPYSLTSVMPNISGLAAKTELDSLVKKTDYDAKIKDLQDQITALKSGTGGTGGTTTGLVSVTLDASTPAQFNGATPATIKVNIKNDTTAYQYVSYFVSLTANTPIFAVSNVSATMPLMTYDTTIIPATGNTYQILLTPNGKMLVPPGVTACYYLLTIKPSTAAVWQMSISSINYSVTP